VSYPSEVLADSPALYYRLDNAGVGVNGEQVPDLSGNDLHGKLVFSGSQAPWGLPSPIETDPASHEFWGYTNAGGYGFSGTSRITRSNDALLQPGGNFWVETWLRPMTNIPLAGDFIMAGKSGSCGVMETYNLGSRIGGFVFDTAGTLWKSIGSFLCLHRLPRPIVSRGSSSHC